MLGFIVYGKHGRQPLEVQMKNRSTHPNRNVTPMDVLAVLTRALMFLIAFGLTVPTTGWAQSHRQHNATGGGSSSGCGPAESISSDLGNVLDIAGARMGLPSRDTLASPIETAPPNPFAPSADQDSEESEKETPCKTAQRKVERRKKELEQILRDLENSETVSRDLSDRLSKWNDAFIRDTKEMTAGEFFFGETGAVTTGTLIQFLISQGKTGKITPQSLLLSYSTGIVLQILKDAGNAMGGLEEANRNGSLHSWLFHYLHEGEAPFANQKVLDFMRTRPNFLASITGERPPKMKKRTRFGIDSLAMDQFNKWEVRDYLQRNAEQIYVFIGLLEEQALRNNNPNSPFPRLTRGAELRGIGDWRIVIKSRTVERLRKTIQWLDQVMVEGGDCDKGAKNATRG